MIRIFKPEWLEWHAQYNKMKKKEKIPHCLNSSKINSRTIVERDKMIPLTHKYMFYDRSLSWLDTGISIISGAGVKLDL